MSEYDCQGRTELKHRKVKTEVIHFCFLLFPKLAIPDPEIRILQRRVSFLTAQSRVHCTGRPWFSWICRLWSTCDRRRIFAFLQGHFVKLLNWRYKSKPIKQVQQNNKPAASIKGRGPLVAFAFVQTTKTSSQCHQHAIYSKYIYFINIKCLTMSTAKWELFLSWMKKIANTNTMLVLHLWNMFINI